MTENRIDQERRRFPRVMAPVYYRSPRILRAKNRVSNISLGGIRIFSDKELKIGKNLEIEIFLPGGDSVSATTRVVWIKPLPPEAEALYDVGLEFISLPPEHQEALKTVLDDSAD